MTYKLRRVFNVFAHAVRTSNERQALLESLQDACAVLTGLNEEALASGGGGEDLIAQQEKNAQPLTAWQQYGPDQRVSTQRLSTQRMNAMRNTLNQLVRHEGASIETSEVSPSTANATQQAMNQLLLGGLPQTMAMSPEFAAALFINPIAISTPLPRMPSTQQLAQEMLRLHPETH
jgi:hypothetical protein